MFGRFGVSYRIFAASGQEANQRAEAIALEQTVEVPRDCVPAGYIEDVVLGQVVSVTPESEGAYLAEISYSMDAVGDGFAQLINVIFGNSSIKKGLKVVGFTPCSSLKDQFSGPRFGAHGVRALIGRKKGGLVCPVIKPMGSTSEILPGPGGGMSVERLLEMVQMYGEDCLYLLGGGLLRFGDRIGEGIKEMRQVLDPDDLAAVGQAAPPGKGMNPACVIRLALLANDVRAE